MASDATRNTSAALGCLAENAYDDNDNNSGLDPENENVNVNVNVDDDNNPELLPCYEDATAATGTGTAGWGPAPAYEDGGGGGDGERRQRYQGYFGPTHPSLHYYDPTHPSLRHDDPTHPPDYLHRRHQYELRRVDRKTCLLSPVPFSPTTTSASATTTTSTMTMSGTGGVGTEELSTTTSYCIKSIPRISRIFGSSSNSKNKGIGEKGKGKKEKKRVEMEVWRCHGLGDGGGGGQVDDAGEEEERETQFVAGIWFDNDGGFPWRPRACFEHYCSSSGGSNGNGSGSGGGDAEGMKRYHMQASGNNFSDWSVDMDGKVFVWGLELKKRLKAFVMREENSDCSGSYGGYEGAVVARFTFSDKGVLAQKGASVGVLEVYGGDGVLTTTTTTTSAKTEKIACGALVVLAFLQKMGRNYTNAGTEGWGSARGAGAGGAVGGEFGG